MCYACILGTPTSIAVKKKIIHVIRETVPLALKKQKHLTGLRNFIRPT